MPIIEIKSLPARPQADVSRAVKNVSWEVAKTLGIPPEAVRALWTSVEPAHYAEGGSLAKEQTAWTHPPIVTITALAGRAPELIEKAVRCAAQTVATDLGVPLENVFVSYHEVPAGRLFTKGNFKK